ncbi:benzoylformate decarboxylase [Bradyrhizobium erythrophlei]|jgi:benzoylformate decarboxylase|uniref:Benzoylformate decarboxylase n=1 Tax=Bradyrhizobium erythrophlei TaxID=1437360 RepID=A0A1M5SSJ7_9BRAD|nr:benzoylformate decarboxylase [Bradyrhizobium erythrophlei]SHH41407.1 benzoylformate decarboxylase [Bradyrhizobium erythrophlei]
MLTVQQAFFEVARRLKLTTIFGNPGSTEETLLKNFPADFRYVLALQEAPAVAMADAYAQATGEAVLVNLHTAAGMGNALGNIESAWYNRAPLIITAGQQTREMLLIEPYLTNTQPLEMPKPFVKWAYEPARPEDVPGALMRAYAMSVQPPAGPVFLSIPMDDVDRPCPQLPEIRSVSRHLGADPKYLAPMVEAMSEARSPVLIIGGAVDQSGGWDDAVRLAERLGCKVWAAPAEGRPGFPETHPLYQGMLTSAIGPLCKQLEGHDVIAVIGAPVFRYYPYVAGDYIPAGSRLFHITDDPSEAGRAPVGQSILADPGRACAVLAELVAKSDRVLPPARPKLAAPVRGVKITADFLYHAINETRPDDSVLVQESLSTLKALRQRLPTSRSRSFYSMSSGVLGYGLPAAVGVALAERDKGSNRKIVNIVGDGAANYVIQALWTAVQHKLPVVFVIPRNGAYNILKAFAHQLDTPGVPGLDLPGLDFVSLAAGYGCSGERVSEHDALSDALRRGMSAKGPHLIEVEIDPTVPPLI